MKLMLKASLCLCLLFNLSGASAQINLEDLKLEDVANEIGKILGQKKILSVEKGFNPIFKIGNYQINSAGILGEKLKGVEILGDIFNSKNIDQVKKLYKTYKTGLIVFKVLAATGTAVAVYGTVRGLSSDTKFSSNTVKALIYPSLVSIGTGIGTKILTKKASYKAVDIFNGAVKKTIKDILSVQPASSTLGVGVYVNL